MILGARAVRLLFRNREFMVADRSSFLYSFTMWEAPNRRGISSILLYWRRAPDTPLQVEPPSRRVSHIPHIKAAAMEAARPPPEDNKLCSLFEFFKAFWPSLPLKSIS